MNEINLSTHDLVCLMAAIVLASGREETPEHAVQTAELIRDAVSGPRCAKDSEGAP